MKEKVILFGASELGKEAFKLLKENYNILFFADNDIAKDGKEFCGKSIILPTKLKDIAFDKIIITSQYNSEIANQLHNMHIENIYIFSSYLKIGSKKKEFYITKAKRLNLYSKDFNFEDFVPKKDKKYSVNSNIKYSKKNVLFFATIFPPSGEGGVQRSLKFVKYLQIFGWNPIVVTLDETYNFWGEDSSFLDELPKDISIVRIKQPFLNVFEIDEDSAKDILSLIFNLIENKKLKEELKTRIIDKDSNLLNRKYIFEPDKFISWVNIVLKTIDEIIDFQKIDLIYTTGDPFSNYFNGYYLKKKHNLPWVADFRDEWTNNPYANNMYKNDSFKVELHKNMENSIVNFADKVVAVTPNSSQNYRDIFNLPLDKVETITNGYDNKDFEFLEKASQKNEKFTIVYYGTLYLNRDLSEIVNAINILIEKNRVEKSNITLKVIGRCDSLVKTSMLVCDKFGVLDFIEYLPHKECLKEGNNADLLILYVGEEDKFKSVYTGKVFEYLRLQKPILAISPQNSEIENLLANTNSGANFNSTNYDEMNEFIYSIYNDWKMGIRENFISKNIEQYERKELTKKLSDIFDSLIN